MMKRKGLTLMELLVVISILSTLAALLFPVYLNLRARTDITVCVDQLRQIGLALKMYAHDYGDDTPYGMPENLGILYPHYIPNKDILVCSAFRKTYFEFVEQMHQLVKDPKWVLPPSNCWSSYFLFIPRSLDKYSPISPLTFAEVYSRRGDQTPIAFCDIHWKGCPESNIDWRISPKSYMINCRTLANLNAPLIILRWSGQVNLIHKKSKNTDVILLAF